MAGCARELAKVLAAAAFVVAAPFMITPIVTSSRWPQPLAWALGIGAVAITAVALWWATRPHDLEQARAMGMTDEREFQATRCLELEWWNDTGPNYLIELTTGECLFLSGQYMCHLEPVSDLANPEENSPREFPAERFRLVRAKRDDFSYTVEPSGRVLEPEGVKRFFTAVPGLQVPDDGEILPAGTYERLKALLPDGSSPAS